jgi:hypothetical protein
MDEPVIEMRCIRSYGEIYLLHIGNVVYPQPDCDTAAKVALDIAFMKAGMTRPAV